MKVGDIIKNKDRELHVIIKIINDIPYSMRIEEYISEVVAIEHEGERKTIKEIIEKYCNEHLKGKQIIDLSSPVVGRYEKHKKDAWVLRLKDESKEEGMTGEYYLDDDGEEMDWLTQNLNSATVFDDKERAINNFKLYEKAIFEKFGEDSICNFGYTNIMKHFEFVQVEITELK